MCETPVVLLIFNRPWHTAQVLERIAAARPARLFVVADGPRSDEDREKCAAARAVVERVDWPCDVQRLYADTNLGIGVRAPSGLDWALAHTERAIILEDDCVPEPSFFAYCDTLLDRYATDDRIMTISGETYWGGKPEWPYSYHFSNYPLMWGWATWRRAWKLFDPDLRAWPELKASGAWTTFWGSDLEREYWSPVMDSMHQGGFPECHDYRWLYTCWSQNGLTIHPAKNLVSNIGYGPDATHTVGSSPLANIKTEPLAIERHPPFVVPLREANQAIFANRFPGSAMQKSKTLSFRLTQPARRAKHWWRTRGQ